MENEVQGVIPTPATEEPTPTPPEENGPHGGDGAPETIAVTEDGGVYEEDGRDTPDYAAMASEDLAVLSAEVAELAGIGTLSALPDPARYGELRELGLSPTEAYYATAGGRARRHTQASRAHLGASVGRSASTAGVRPSAAELSEARDLFPNLTDREIEALYRRAVAQQA